jgi:hypothetical protein
MSDIQKAIDAVKLAELSLHPDKAPRYSRDVIEAEREKASVGLLLALDLLTKQLEGVK